MLINRKTIVYTFFFSACLLDPGILHRYLKLSDLLTHITPVQKILDDVYLRRNCTHKWLEAFAYIAMHVFGGLQFFESKRTGYQVWGSVY